MKELFDLVNDVNQTIEKLHATEFLLCRVSGKYSNTVKLMQSINCWLSLPVMEVTIKDSSASIKIVKSQYKSLLNNLISTRVLNLLCIPYNHGFKIGTMLHICNILLTKIENLKIKEAV